MINLKSVQRSCRRCGLILRAYCDAQTKPEWVKSRRVSVDNFLGVNSEEGVVDTGLADYDRNLALHKYDYLFRKRPASSEEKVFVTSFGEIRYDADNTPRASKSSQRANYIEEQYLGSYASQEQEEDDESYEVENYTEKQYARQEEKEDKTYEGDNYIEKQYMGSYTKQEQNDELKIFDGSNFIDEQYFNVRCDLASSEIKHIQEDDLRVEAEDVMPSRDHHSPGDNYIENMFFGPQLQNQKMKPLQLTPNVSNDVHFNPAFPGETFVDFNIKPSSQASSSAVSKAARPLRTEDQKQTFETTKLSRDFKVSTKKSEDVFGDLNQIKKPKTAVNQNKNVYSEGHDRDEESERPIHETKLEKKWRQEKEAVKSNQPKTAFDYVLRRRKVLKNSNPESDKEEGEDKPSSSHKAEKVDSKGFRILDDQVQDLEEFPEIMVLQLLKNNILYNENDIVALNKPYGLPVQPGAGHRHFLTKFLPELVKYVSKGNPNTELYTVHRLDKETTGVLLLAKTQKMADILHNMFAEGKIIKTYWALTKGVPAPSKGVIDIPMYEATIDGKARMMLKVEYNEETKDLVKKTSLKTHRAITGYSVISSKDNAALVELKPSTGVKHQLRVHLASALGCPVLGDHKYSHFLRLAPQKLTSDILQKLHIRQSKVRHLAMHLHARAIAIPELIDGRNIVIGARLPGHFSKNMKRLEIQWPKL